MRHPCIWVTICFPKKKTVCLSGFMNILGLTCYLSTIHTHNTRFEQESAFCNVNMLLLLVPILWITGYVSAHSSQSSPSFSTPKESRCRQHAYRKLEYAAPQHSSVSLANGAWTQKVCKLSHEKGNNQVPWCLSQPFCVWWYDEFLRMLELSFREWNVD